MINPKAMFTQFIPAAPGYTALILQHDKDGYTVMHDPIIAWRLSEMFDGHEPLLLVDPVGLEHRLDEGLGMGIQYPDGRVSGHWQPFDNEAKWLEYAIRNHEGATNDSPPIPPHRFKEMLKAAGVVVP